MLPRLSSALRELRLTAAFALASLAVAARLDAADFPASAPVKRPSNPCVCKFNLGQVEAFSFSDGCMLFRPTNLRGQYHAYG